MNDGQNIDPLIAARYSRDAAAKRAALGDIVEERFREDHAARRLHWLLHHLAPYDPVAIICVVVAAAAMRVFNFGIYTVLTYLGVVIAFSILFHLTISILLLPVRKSIVSGWISHLLFVSAHGFFVDADPFGGESQSQNGFTALAHRVIGTKMDIDWQQSQEIALYSAIALAISYCFIIVQAKSRPPAQL